MTLHLLSSQVKRAKEAIEEKAALHAKLEAELQNAMFTGGATSQAFAQAEREKASRPPPIPVTPLGGPPARAPARIVVCAHRADRPPLRTRSPRWMRRSSS